MERIQALIDRLYLQKQQNTNPAQLLLTVQLLQSELLKLQKKNGTLGTAKVAVTLPMNLNFFETDTGTTESVEAKPETLPVPEVILEQTTKPQVPQYSIPKPEIKEEPVQKYSIPKREIKDEPIIERVPTYSSNQKAFNPAFNSVVETPTLSHNMTGKEVHEAIAENKESLNDRLKQDKKELAHALKESPIKDLRKGIGINDRFTFVNELFRNDEAMYERSIKTINSFHIFSEAEYWINRELKFKLGWDDRTELVEHFYHLVRRRFS